MEGGLWESGGGFKEQRSREPAASTKGHPGPCIDAFAHRRHQKRMAAKGLSLCSIEEPAGKTTWKKATRSSFCRGDAVGNITGTQRYGAPFAEQSKAKPQRAQLTGPHVNKQAPSEKLAHGKSWAPPRHRSGTPWRAPGCHALVPTGQPRDACTSPGDLRGHGFSGQVPFAPARVWTSVF